MILLKYADIHQDTFVYAGLFDDALMTGAEEIVLKSGEAAEVLVFELPGE